MATAQAWRALKDGWIAAEAMPAGRRRENAGDFPARRSGIDGALWRLMRRCRPPTPVLLAGLVAIAMAGCATSPEQANRQAYDAYWQCAVHAVRPYVVDQRFTARDAALAAQGHCDTPYARFRGTQIGVVRSKVDRDSADLASQLGGQQALIMYGRVTRALTDYVRNARRN